MIGTGQTHCWDRHDDSSSRDQKPDALSLVQMPRNYEDQEYPSGGEYSNIKLRQRERYEPRSRITRIGKRNGGGTSGLTTLQGLADRAGTTRRGRQLVECAANARAITKSRGLGSDAPPSGGEGTRMANDTAAESTTGEDDASPRSGRRNRSQARKLGHSSHALVLRRFAGRRTCARQ